MQKSNKIIPPDFIFESNGKHRKFYHIKTIKHLRLMESSKVNLHLKKKRHHHNRTIKCQRPTWKRMTNMPIPFAVRPPTLHDTYFLDVWFVSSFWLPSPNILAINLEHQFIVRHLFRSKVYVDSFTTYADISSPLLWSKTCSESACGLRWTLKRRGITSCSYSDRIFLPPSPPSMDTNQRSRLGRRIKEITKAELNRSDMK